MGSFFLLLQNNGAAECAFPVCLAHHKLLHLRCGSGENPLAVKIGCGFLVFDQQRAALNFILNPFVIQIFEPQYPVIQIYLEDPMCCTQLHIDCLRLGLPWRRAEKFNKQTAPNVDERGLKRDP